MAGHSQLAYDASPRVIESAEGAHMWSNRWVRVGSVAVGFLLIVAIAQFISFLVGPDDEEIVPAPAQGGVTADLVISVVGVLAVVGLLAGCAVWWSVRYAAGRVVADLGIASVGGAFLALALAPFAGGDLPFSGGIETFVVDMLQFIGFGALGILLGFAGTVVTGKDYRSRGLAAYAERHGKRAGHPAPGSARRR
jgi:hypothetical protein